VCFAGEIVKRLQQVTGARIQIPRGDDGPGIDVRDVTVSGRPEQCEFARAEIEAIINARGMGPIDPMQIGSGSGYGGGGPPPQQGYGGGGGGYQQGPPQGYGGGGGYGGPPQHGGYGGPPPQQGGYGGYGQQPQHDPYGPPGVGPSHHQQGPPPQQQHHQAPPPQQEVDAPVPPTDPAAFEGWWGTLSLPQQQAYYKKYYPEMLAQLQ
jgi:far upstream element-binding protein